MIASSSASAGANTEQDYSLQVVVAIVWSLGARHVQRGVMDEMLRVLVVLRVLLVRRPCDKVYRDTSAFLQ